MCDLQHRFSLPLGLLHLLGIYRRQMEGVWDFDEKPLDGILIPKCLRKVSNRVFGLWRTRRVEKGERAVSLFLFSSSL